MRKAWESKRVFLVGGPGGVGKTTLAASLGIALAEAGHRTVVLTVDPARRLAQALGLVDFKADLQEIALGKAGAATLHASMLDTQRDFDRVVGTFATSEAQKEKILRNPLYRTMVENLGGSHEYAAMERLLEFARDARFDKVVVDTPPSDNARELFDAPQRLADFMDTSVLKWFQGGGKFYTQLFRSGTRFAMGVLRRVFGADFLDALEVFLSDLQGMEKGFRQRNLDVQALLRAKQSTFLLVTVPSQARMTDCERFALTLREKGIDLSLLALNQLELPPPPLGAGRGYAPLENAIHFQHELHTHQMAWAQRIHEAVGNIQKVEITRKDGALHDLSALSELGRLLVE